MDIAGTGQSAEVRALCVSLVVQAVVSYRSVPRILGLFGSAINWTLRLGLGLLNQVGAIDAPWLAIIDHSIDIGVNHRPKVSTCQHPIFSSCGANQGF